MCHTRANPALGSCRNCIRSVGILLVCQHISNPCLRKSNQLLTYSAIDLIVCIQAEAKPTRLFIVIIALLHAGLALTFKILFFNYYVVNQIGPGGDILVPGTNGTMSLR